MAYRFVVGGVPGFWGVSHLGDLGMAAMEDSRVLIASMGRKANHRGWDFDGWQQLFPGAEPPLDIIPYFARRQWDAAGEGRNRRPAVFERGSEQVQLELAGQLDSQIWEALKPRMADSNTVLVSCNWGKHRSAFMANVIALVLRRHGSQQIMFLDFLAERLERPCMAPQTRFFAMQGPKEEVFEGRGRF